MFATEACTGFYMHWQHLRPDDAVIPSRAQLDPCEMPRLLPHVIVYDVAATPDTVTYRLVGTEITRRWGFDPTGRPYAEVVGGDEGWESARAILRVAHEAVGLRLLRRQVRPSGALDDVEVCCLPVWHDGRGAAQAMSVSAALAPGGRPLDTHADPVRERILLEREHFELAAAASPAPPL